MKIQGKAAEQVEKLVELFKSGNVPESIAKIALTGENVPSGRWSMLNRWISFIQSGDTDCRGFRQWEQAGRRVKKGEKAAWILAPNMIKKEDKETGEKEYFCVGFRSIPVFGVSQTEGEPVNNGLEPVEYPSLFDLAVKMGITVKYGTSDSMYGAYLPGKNLIELCTHDEQTFFHELAHAIHHTIKPLKNGQVPGQEIVAEFSACVLSRMYGKKSPNEGYTYNYLKNYASKINKTVVDSVYSFIADIMKIVEFVISKKEIESIAA